MSSDRVGAWATTGRAGDPGLVRAVAFLRVLVGVAICIGALFVKAEEPDTRLWLLIVAAGWLPLSVGLLLATRLLRNRWILPVGAACDLIMLAAAQALLHQGIGLTSCYPIIAAFAAYTSPGVPTWAVGGFTLALSLSVQSQLPESQRFTAPRFALFAALVMGVLLIVERATARSRGAEERFARAQTRADVILASVGTSVVVTDIHSRILTTNPAADRALGDGQPLEGRACSEVLRLHLGERRLDCSAGCQLLAAASRDAGASDDPAASDVPRSPLPDAPHDFEAWRPAKDGGRQPLLVSVNPLPATDGPDVEVVHTVRDITRLKQADEAKTLFLATASHELKTPLTVINGFAKTLTTRQLTPEKQRDALAAIRRRGEELARVVDRLLLSSRIEAGRAEVSRTPVDLIPLLYERAAGLGTATDRLIEVDLPDDLPSVMGDPSAITTVVDHLLDNAVKYSPEGDVVLVCSQHEIAADGPGTVVIEISDSGVGMDPETLEHCFEKFWQADGSGTRRFGGTGIGLYIVRSLVEAMNGTVSVRSSQPGGSTFAVRLTAASDESVGSPAVPETRAAGQGEPAANPRRRRAKLSRQIRTSDTDSAPLSLD